MRREAYRDDGQRRVEGEGVERADEAPDRRAQGAADVPRTPLGMRAHVEQNGRVGAIEGGAQHVGVNLGNRSEGHPGQGAVEQALFTRHFQSLFHALRLRVEHAVHDDLARTNSQTTMNLPLHDHDAREELLPFQMVPIDEDALVISAELMPVAVFLGWRWGEVRPDREISRQAA